MPSPWRVDDDVNERIDFEMANAGDPENMEIERAVDSALQQMARTSRAQIRSKMVYNGGECSVEDGDHTPCIEAMDNEEDWLGPCGDDTLAWALCGTNGCNVVLCQERDWGGKWGSGHFGELVAHEIGHIYGMGHVDAGNGDLDGCGGGMDSSASFCAGSDGCDGELMCTVNGCALSGFVTNGDSISLREEYGSASNRAVYFGRDSLADGVSNPTRYAATNLAATFAPRMDCASAQNAVNRCAAVIAVNSESQSSPSTIRIIKMNTMTSTGWQSVLSTTISDKSIQPPDITVNDDGTTAWVTYVNTNNTLIVRKIDLGYVNSAPMVSTLLSLASVDGSAVRPVLPPRIDHQDGAVFVLAATAVSASLQRFSAPRFRLIRVNLSTSTSDFVDFLTTSSDVDIDGQWSFNHTARNEFDFVCRQESNLARCTIVVNYATPESTAYISQKLRSMSFTVDGTGALTASPLQTNFATSVASTNGVIGVAYHNDGGLIVSHSNPVGNGTSTINTFVHRFASDSVASTVVSELGHRGDATTCNSGSNHGVSFGAASMHGGYSVAYCPTCGTNGTLESISWGADAYGHCF